MDDHHDSMFTDQIWAGLTEAGEGYWFRYEAGAFVNEDAAGEAGLVAYARMETPSSFFVTLEWPDSKFEPGPRPLNSFHFTGEEIETLAAAIVSGLPFSYDDCSSVCRLFVDMANRQRNARGEDDLVIGEQRALQWRGLPINVRRELMIRACVGPPPPFEASIERFPWEGFSDFDQGRILEAVRDLAFLADMVDGFGQ